MPKNYVEEHDSIVIQCKSKNIPRWFIGGQTIPPPNVHISSYDHITINGVNENNKGTYQCQGVTEFGKIFRARGQLKVIGKLKSSIFL